jgi:hypothetical protein
VSTEKLPAPTGLKLSDLPDRASRVSFISTCGLEAYKKLVAEAARERGTAAVAENKAAQKAVYDKMGGRQ